MDPVKNPYSPGAGSPPPQLAGRTHLLENARIGLERKRIGRSHKGQIFVGLRGVGKTVLLQRVSDIAESQGYHTASLEVSEAQPLKQVLVPPLRSILYNVDRLGGVNEKVKRALRVLRSFVGRIDVSLGGLEMGIEPETGTADSGDLEADLAQLFQSVGEAAYATDRGIAIICDELQYLPEPDFAALILALHRISQRSLPLAFVGAGLPSVRGLAGRARSYAERLFDYPMIGPLSTDAVRDAVQIPAQREGASFSPEAVSQIERITEGYPYFVQEWAYTTWNRAAAALISEQDVIEATADTIANLDASFFRVRFDRLTNAEKRYLRAMAELGAGPHRSGEIAEVYGAKVQSVGPLRAALISKGIVYSPYHGDTAFTVPLFDGFMKRSMPN